MRIIVIFSLLVCLPAGQTKINNQNLKKCWLDSQCSGVRSHCCSARFRRPRPVTPTRKGRCMECCVTSHCDVGETCVKTPVFNIHGQRRYTKECEYGWEEGQHKKM